ncbi:MAG TPA: MBL fold metallo-hydrolase [Pyrinomonadaceae bacterium]|jgi:glyoxylase-like metal-dependent hydrolase (beta-lactamase superfamily II)
MKKLFAILAATLVCAAASARAHTHGHRSLQADFSKVEIKTTKVAGNVYMLEGAGGNIGVTAGPDGMLIVDDQFAPLADKIRAALRQINPNARLRFVLNTHWHFDHTGGNAAFSTESTILAHMNVRKRMAVGATVAGQTIPPASPEALPLITYNEGVQIHFNGEEIRVVHYPAGHTDGDSIIFFTGANVIHMGDHFFASRFPFVDLNSGGSVEGLTRNIAQVIATAPAGVKIIPGHGPLSTIDDLKTYHQMLVETSGIVRQRVAAGRTLEQIKAEGLPEKWKSWGTGFINTERWLETLYRTYKQNEGRTPGALLRFPSFYELDTRAHATLELKRLD